MAAEIVCVSPGMLETKVMVAPNSPSARAKHMTAPAMMPGSASGSVTVKNTQKRLAPSVAAASSSRRSMASSASLIGRTMSGKPMTPQASAAPAERNEQQIAGDHRRQHQRQIDDPVEQGLSPKVLARKQPAESDAERQCECGRDDRNAQRQFDRSPFVRREMKH